MHFCHHFAASAVSRNRMWTVPIRPMASVLLGKSSTSRRATEIASSFMACKLAAGAPDGWGGSVDCPAGRAERSRGVSLA
jgi:hypothetical protein